MDSKQFAWLYLIENGQAYSEHSVYGGYDVLIKVPEKVSYFKRHEYLNNLAISEIKQYGIDWVKTEAPRSETKSVFNGTFCDAGEKEVLTGALVLKNGKIQPWVADALEVVNVFDMMASADEAAFRAKHLLGIDD